MAPLWQIFIFWDPKTPLYKSKDTLATHLVTSPQGLSPLKFQDTLATNLHPLWSTMFSFVDCPNSQLTCAILLIKKTKKKKIVACPNSPVQSSLSLGRTNRLVKCAKPSGFCKPEDHFCFQCPKDWKEMLVDKYECRIVRKKDEKEHQGTWRMELRRQYC